MVGEPIDDDLLARTDELEVLAVRMPVLSATEIMASKLSVLGEHYCDFSRLLPVARAMREQIDWSDVRERVDDNPYARAFLFLLDELAVVDAQDMGDDSWARAPTRPSPRPGTRQARSSEPDPVRRASGTDPGRVWSYRPPTTGGLTDEHGHPVDRRRRPRPHGLRPVDPVRGVPRFMEGVEEIRQLDATHTHWKTKIGGVEREFDAEITEQHPDERVAWNSTSGPDHAGVVTFHRLNDTQTRVTVQLDWTPGGRGEGGRRPPARRAPRQGDLARFKEFIESRGAETGAWRGDVS